MNKLTLITALLALAVIAAPITKAQTTDTSIPVTTSVDLGFKSKLIEQGVVTGSNLIVAGTEFDVSSFDLGVDTYSTYQKGTNYKTGLFKRTDVTLGYKFTSVLADLTLGATYRDEGQVLTVAGIKSGVLPFVKLNGNVSVFTWDVTMLDDVKNHNTNYEANARLPIGFGVEHLKLVPVVGVGFNNPSTDTVSTFEASKKYYNGGLDLAYITKVGTVSIGVFALRENLDNTTGQVTGYDAIYAVKF